VTTVSELCDQLELLLRDLAEEIANTKTSILTTVRALADEQLDPPQARARIQRVLTELVERTDQAGRALAAGHTTAERLLADQTLARMRDTESRPGSPPALDRPEGLSRIGASLEPDRTDDYRRGENTVAPRDLCSPNRPSDGLGGLASIPGDRDGLSAQTLNWDPGAGAAHPGPRSELDTPPTTALAAAVTTHPAAHPTPRILAYPAQHPHETPPTAPGTGIESATHDYPPAHLAPSPPHASDDHVPGPGHQDKPGDHSHQPGHDVPRLITGHGGPTPQPIVGPGGDGAGQPPADTSPGPSGEAPSAATTNDDAPERHGDPGNAGAAAVVDPRILPALLSTRLAASGTGTTASHTPSVGRRTPSNPGPELTDNPFDSQVMTEDLDDQELLSRPAQHQPIAYQPESETSASRTRAARHPRHRVVDQ
jgi:hypothetical protein